MDKLVEANQRALDLQYMLDSAQREIETLKDKLVEEKAWWVFATSPDGIDDKFLADFRKKTGSCPFDDRWLDEARQQLKAEMPEVDWDDAQAAKIEALKEKLILVTAESNFYATNGMNSYDSFRDSEMKTEYLQEARQQLKAEMPEVDWDE